jgi:hypothetical protein
MVLNMIRSSALLATLFVLAGCASSPTDRVGQAAATPLNDLNLVHAPIPEALLAAQKAPYGVPADTGCPALTQEIHALDEVLGPDLDAPASPSNPGLMERGERAAGDAAGDALKRTAEGVIPFRGWVRKLTGAERYSRQVAAAITAGTVRRGFLKGLRTAKTCA